MYKKKYVKKTKKFWDNRLLIERKTFVDPVRIRKKILKRK